MNKNLVSNLKQLTKTNNFKKLKAQYIAATSGNPIDAVIIQVKATETLPSYFIKLSLASNAYDSVEIPKAAQENRSPKDFGEFDYLQFFVSSNLNIPTEKLDQIGKQIFEINDQLPLVGFNLSTIEETQITYRHLMLIRRNEIDVMLSARAAELIFFLMRTFIPIFQKTLSEE